MLDLLLSKSLGQSDKIDQIIKLANKSIDDSASVDDGDRVWFTFISSFDFVMGDEKVQDLNFTVPNDADFIAKRLSFVTRMNRHNAVAAVDPVGFFHSVQFPYESTAFNKITVDFQIELLETYTKDGNMVHRSYQDLPIPAYLTYSRNNPIYGSPSAMCFDLDWEIRRGSVMQCKVSVLTAIPETGVSADVHDTYRIVAMLEGCKKVRAFK